MPRRPLLGVSSWRIVGEARPGQGGSLVLEYPTVGDLREWLLEYYS